MSGDGAATGRAVAKGSQAEMRNSLHQWSMWNFICKLTSKEEN